MSYYTRSGFSKNIHFGFTASKRRLHLPIECDPKLGESNDEHRSDHYRVAGHQHNQDRICRGKPSTLSTLEDRAFIPPDEKSASYINNMLQKIDAIDFVQRVRTWEPQAHGENPEGDIRGHKLQR